MDTAFTFVGGTRWAPLFAIVGFTLVVANFGSGMGAQLGAARLLYGMGRSNALPQVVLWRGRSQAARAAQQRVVRGLPSRSSARFCSSLGSLQLRPRRRDAQLRRADRLHGREPAAFVRYFVRAKKKFWQLLSAAAGFVICLLLWLNLSRKAWLVGSIWMVVGIAFGAWKTRGFRGNLVDFELPPEE